jgi:hypothetical protein
MAAFLLLKAEFPQLAQVGAQGLRIRHPYQGDKAGCGEAFRHHGPSHDPSSGFALLLFVPPGLSPPWIIFILKSTSTLKSHGSFRFSPAQHPHIILVTYDGHGLQPPNLQLLPC